MRDHVAVTSSRPRFDAERAKAAAQRLRYNEIRAALEEVTVQVQAVDRSFSVEMAVGGAVTAVHLTEAAMDKTPQTLSRELVATLNEGMRQIAARTNEVVAPFLSSADLDLAAITSGRLPKAAEPPPKADWIREIEDASRIPKRPLGRYARPAADPGVDPDVDPDAEEDER